MTNINGQILSDDDVVSLILFLWGLLQTEEFNSLKRNSVQCAMSQKTQLGARWALKRIYKLPLAISLQFLMFLHKEKINPEEANNSCTL